MLFESLAKQTSTDFELICIDDTGPMDPETGLRGPPERRSAAVAYARRLGVPLVALVSSKKKVRGLRFGQCNAINSGLVLAAGKFITVIQDNVWLLPTFVERTLAFFATHDRDVLLSYPERRVAPPPQRLKREWMHNTSVRVLMLTFLCRVSSGGRCSKALMYTRSCKQSQRICSAQSVSEYAHEQRTDTHTA